MKNTRLKVVCVEPDKSAYEKEIDSGLASLQKEVGGSIQMLSAFDDSAVIICNDEGKLQGLPLNRAMHDDEGNVYDVISGNFIIVDAPYDSDDFSSLSEEQIKVYLAKYKNKQSFLYSGNVITILENLSE